MKRICKTLLRSAAMIHIPQLSPDRPVQKMFYSASFLVPLILFALLGILFFRYRRLSSVAGPSLASITGFWRFYHTWNGTFSTKLRQLHTRHGHFVRIGPNTVSVSDPASIGTIYSMHGEFRKVRRHTFRSHSPD